MPGRTPYPETLPETGPTMERTFINAARRTQIVRAAIDTLAELGYAKASFVRITERAGLRSPRMISYHFSGKDDLIRQVLRDVREEAGGFVAGRTEQEDTAAGRLRAHLESTLAYIRDHPAEVAALTEIGPHLRDGRGRPHTSQSAQDWSVRALEALLSEGQRTGAFREFDVRAMAVIVRGAIGAAAARVRGEPGLDLDAYARELVTTVALATQAAPPD